MIDDGLLNRVPKSLLERLKLHLGLRHRRAPLSIEPPEHHPQPSARCESNQLAICDWTARVTLVLGCS